MLSVTPCDAESDETVSLRIFNTVWPRDAVTIDEVRAYRDSAVAYLDCLVRDEDGVPLGSAVGAIFGHDPHRCETLISVLREQRRRGAGAALYGAVSDWGGSRGARQLEVAVADDDPVSLAVAERAGFRVNRHEAPLVLSLAGLAPMQEPTLRGITIVSWAQHPELARGMFEVDAEARPDIPGFETAAGESFDEWMSHRLQRSADSPDATFIALAEDEVVGYAKLTLTPPTAGHSMTAVKRAWRGRGIARALKIAEINWAMAHGYTELHTSNEDRNTPMRTVNRRLGYQPGVGRSYLLGPLHHAADSPR